MDVTKRDPGIYARSTYIRMASHREGGEKYVLCGGQLSEDGELLNFSDIALYTIFAYWSGTIGISILISIGVITAIDKSRYIIRLSMLLNILNIFIYSPKNDLSLPKIIRNDVATIPKATPIIIAFLPATVG